MRGGHNQNIVFGRIVNCYRGLFNVSGNVSHDRFLQTLEETKLDCTVFLVVQEILTHWPRIITRIGSTGPLQEFQHVVGRVSTWVLVSLFDFG